MKAMLKHMFEIQISIFLHLTSFYIQDNSIVSISPPHMDPYEVCFSVLQQTFIVASSHIQGKWSQGLFFSLT